MENNIKIERKGEKVIIFLKKYGYFIVAGLIVLTITLTVLFTSLSSAPVIDDPNDNGGDVIDTGTKALVFNNPLAGCTIALDYSIDKLVYNTTLGWYETHSAVDLVSETSTDVLATCAGTVTEIYSNTLEGTVVKIKHNDQYTTLYGSLNEELSVAVGDSVTAGQKIGTISTSAGNESLLGSHLHFQIIKDNADVNPNDYLSLGK
jgi:murein DD-endopeptidase MepM/ murein hydrolase activator NlpD